MRCWGGAAVLGERRRWGSGGVESAAVMGHDGVGGCGGDRGAVVLGARQLCLALV